MRLWKHSFSPAHPTEHDSWVQVNTKDHIFTYYQYWSVTELRYFSSGQLSGENDMQLFLGKGPSQRLGDGNDIFNKWPGKLLIIVPFVVLQFLCPESLSSHRCLLDWKQEYWNCVLCCMLFCLYVLLHIYHVTLLLTWHIFFFFLVILVKKPGEMQETGILKDVCFISEMLVEFYNHYSFIYIELKD